MRRAGRVRALSIHAGYRCRHSGACCTSGWAIPVEPETEDRLRAALRSGSLRPVEPPTALDFPSAPVAAPGEWEPSDRHFRRVPGLSHGARVILGTDPAGSCVFREPRRARPGSCTVHRDLGEEALPSACRHFPRVVTLSPLGVSVTLSHYCPTAAGMLFVIPRSFVSPSDEESAGPASILDSALAIVENPEAFPAQWPYEGLDARKALPPLLRPGVLMDWPSLERWERFAVSVLAEEGRSPEAALDVLAAAAEEARRWTPADGPFAPFFEKGLLSPRALSFRRASVAPGDEESACVGMTPAWQLTAECVPPGAPRPATPEGLDEADERWVAPTWPTLSLPIRRWLATKAFASWIALQGDGLRTTVAFLRVALGVLRAEAARGAAEASRRLDADRLLEAVRRTDLLLVHLADPEALARRISRGEAREGPTAAW